jgi:penicillin amidase
MLKAIVIGVAATVLLLSLMESHTGAVHFKEESLKGRLNIYRDEQGLARVVADNREDLFYGVGWASAQDRLFTLHEKRMFLEGRMSEMFGDATLPLDRYLRNINLFGIGQANDKLTDNETRSYLEAYVRGINDYADSLKIWPLDFYVLWTTWEPFTTAHSHAMVALFSLTLEFDWMFEIARERLKETVGLDLAAKLIPSCSEDLF